MSPDSFQKALLTWFDHQGRHQLPWQIDKTFYRVWISEIMLQQTQVTTVIPYFLRFVERFPTVQALAEAPLDAVLAHWSGLGYYARARNLHRAAEIIVRDYHGQFPQTLEQALTLPGLGRSTASAILAIVDQQRLPILDGNVKRVLSRFWGVAGFAGEPKVAERLWQLSTECMATTERIGDYTQAIMDLGALVCTRSRPRCGACPLNTDCVAYQTQQVALYPAPKPKRVRPVITEYWLCLWNQSGQVWLESPQSGRIWKGLWAFPSYAERAVLAQYLAEQSSILSTEWLAPREHAFTHRLLRYHPVVVRCQGDWAPSTHGRWFDKQALTQVGLPAPVQKLITEVSKT